MGGRGQACSLSAAVFLRLEANCISHISTMDDLIDLEKVLKLLVEVFTRWLYVLHDGRSFQFQKEANSDVTAF